MEETLTRNCEVGKVVFFDSKNKGVDIQRNLLKYSSRDRAFITLDGHVTSGSSPAYQVYVRVMAEPDGKQLKHHMEGYFSEGTRPKSEHWIKFQCEMDVFMIIVDKQNEYVQMKPIDDKSNTRDDKPVWMSVVALERLNDMQILKVV